MVKFFRHIRQNFLAENKFSKYLFYAIGEIILVVIGILLALQINTWSTNKNAREKEQLYLKSFYSDIQTNLDQLDRVINKSEGTVNAADSLLRFANGDLEIKEMGKIQRLVMVSSNYTIFLSQEGTINDIFGSGDLALIQNDSIRKIMVNWTADLKYLREFEDLGKINQSKYRDYLAGLVPMHQRGMGKIFVNEETIDKLKEDYQYLNLVFDQKRLARILNSLYGDIRDDVSNLLNLVSNDIDSND